MFYYRFPETLLFKFSGPHAERYLQARLSNDVKNAGQSRAIQAAALTAQGKVEALVRVWKDQDAFLLCCDGGDRAEIHSALLRFKVADQLECVDLSDEFFHLYLDSPATDLQATSGLSETSHGTVVSLPAGGYGVVSSRLSHGGLELFVPCAKSAEFIEDLQKAGVVEIATLEFDQRRLSLAVGSFPEDLHHRLLMEMKIAGVISNRKGCYVGQEVVERIASHGKSPRVLFAGEISGAFTVQPGMRAILTESGDEEQEKPVTLLYAIGDSAHDRTLVAGTCRVEDLIPGKNFFLQARPFLFISQLRGDLTEEE